MMFFSIVTVSLFAGGKTEKNMEGKVAVAATFDAMKELTEIRLSRRELKLMILNPRQEI